MGVNSRDKRIRVTFYHRKPRRYNNFSIENYFNSVRLALPNNIIATTKVSKYESNGIFKRLYNSLEAISGQSDVNHITGDVNYLAYFLKRKKNSTVCDGLWPVKSIKRH